MKFNRISLDRRMYNSKIYNIIKYVEIFSLHDFYWVDTN